MPSPVSLVEDALVLISPKAKFHQVLRYESHEDVLEGRGKDVIKVYE